MFKKVVFLGNCQAGVLRMIYETQVAQHTHATAFHVDSAGPLSAHSRHLLETADAVVEQVYTRTQPGNLFSLKLSARIIRFPYVSGHFLWPYAGEGHPLLKHGAITNPFLGVETGDARLVRIFRSSIHQDKQISDYYREDVALTRHVDRMCEMHLEMQHDRDVAAQSVPIAEVIDAGFRKASMFTSPGHPRLQLFLPVIDAVLDGLDVPPTLRRAVTDGLLVIPFSPTEVPIHPSIGAHLGLDYALRHARFLSPLGERVTFLEWCQNYVHLDYNRTLAQVLAQFKNHHELNDDETLSAIRSILEAIGSSAGSLHAETMLIRMYRRLGLHQAELAHARRALFLASESAAAWFDYATAAHRTGNLILAEEALHGALDLRPNAARLHSELSLVLAGLGHHKEALEFARSGAGSNPYDPVIQSRLRRLQDAQASSALA